MSVERRFAEGRFTTLKRLIPGDSADTVLLGALIAIVLVLVAAGASLATWGTPGWGSPMQIPRQGLGTQILDDVVMNRAGDGFAAWTQARDDGYQVEVAQFLPDSGWGLGIPVDQGVGFGQAKVARLEVSEAGDAFVVWTELVTPAEIWSNRFLSGKGWGSPTLLHRVDNARIVKMVTAMDERGNGIVLWSQGEPDPVNGGEVGRLYASRMDRFTGWESPIAVGTGWASDVVLLDNGTAMGVWAATSGAFNLLGRGPPEGPWSSPVTLNPAGSGEGGSRVCMTGEGRLLAVWEEWKDNMFSLWSSAFADASGWSPPEPLPTISGGSVFGDLACTRKGDAVVLSISYPSAERLLLATWWNMTTGWSKPLPIGTPIATGASWPRVAVDGRGDSAAVWWQLGDVPHAFVSQFAKDSSQTSAVQLDPTGPAGGAGGPQVDMDASGDILVAWNQGGGPGEEVWANRYFVPDSGTLRIPVLTLSGVITAAAATSGATAWWWRRALRGSQPGS